jgi:hypothetical protein
MSVITKMRKQDAVYWAPGAYDGYGQPTLGTATAIKCRWEDVSEQFLDATGQDQLSNARVYVDRTIELGGMLWLGVIGSAPDDPKLDDDAWEVRKYESVPNFKATEFLKSVLL